MAWLIVSLFILFPLASRAVADATIPSLLPQFGLRLNGTEGDTQELITQLSKRLAADPYRAELYYHLARAYDKQGWHEKAAQYMNQWIKLNNRDVFAKDSRTFMLDEKNDKLLVIDNATKQVIKKMDLGWSPKRIIPTPDGSQLYVPNALANTVSAIDTEKLAVSDTINVGRMPWNGKSSPLGERVYVTNLKSDSVSVIDTKSNAILESVKVGRGPWGIAVSPDGHRLYVSNQNSQDIQIVDTGSYSVVDVISVGTHPRDIALAPDNANKLYALDRDIANDEIEIYVVDLEDPRVVRALNVPATNDPLLSRFEDMSLRDKLALLGDVVSPERKSRESTPKPKMSDFPALMSMFSPPKGPVRPVTDRDATPGEVELPMGGPAPLAGPEPLMRAYIKAPVVSSGEPLLLPMPPTTEQTPVENRLPVAQLSVGPAPEPKQAAAESKGESKSDAPPEPARQEITVKQEVTVKQERQILRIIVVVRHDSLWKISLDNYGKANDEVYTEIQDVNQAIKNPDRIYVGQKIKLPVLNTYTAYEGKSVKVKSNDNLFRIALNNYGIANKKVYAEIQKANPRIKDVALITIGQRIVLPAISNIPFRERA